MAAAPGLRLALQTASAYAGRSCLANIGELISHPKAMEAMMGMIKLDLPTLEAAAKQDGQPLGDFM